MSNILYNSLDCMYDNVHCIQTLLLDDALEQNVKTYRLPRYNVTEDCKGEAMT